MVNYGTPEAKDTEVTAQNGEPVVSNTSKVYDCANDS